MRYCTVNKRGQQLVDRFWDEGRLAERAQNEPDMIFFLPVCWENVIESVRYKPGWTLEYRSLIDYDQEWLVVTARVPDRDNPAVLTSVGRTWVLPKVENLHEKAAMDYIRRAIQDVEMHEVDEWIKFDGERVFDPHKGQ